MTRALYRFHRWIGLALGLLILVQALTGLALSQRELLRSWGLDQPLDDKRPFQSLDRSVAVVEAGFPGYRIDRIIFSEDRRLPLVVRIVPPGEKNFDVVEIDPKDARIVRSGPIWRFPLQLAERLHVALLLGETGKLILLVEALGLLFMTGTGLYLWWPRSGRLLKALTIRLKGPSMRVIRELHLVPGAMAAILIILSSLTGAALVAPWIVRPVVGSFASFSSKPPPLWPEITRPETPIGWQAALDMLRHRFPDGRLRQVRMAGEDNRILGAVMVATSAVNPRAHHIVFIDRWSGEMSILADGNRLSPGEEILSWPLPLHTGEAYGALRTPLMAALGTVLSAMTITGFLLWVKKRRFRVK